MILTYWVAYAVVICLDAYLLMPCTDVFRDPTKGQRDSRIVAFTPRYGVLQDSLCSSMHHEYIPRKYCGCRACAFATAPNQEVSGTPKGHREDLDVLAQSAEKPLVISVETAPVACLLVESHQAGVGLYL